MYFEIGEKAYYMPEGAKAKADATIERLAICEPFVPHYSFDPVAVGNLSYVLDCINGVQAKNVLDYCRNGVILFLTDSASDSDVKARACLAKNWPDDYGRIVFLPDCNTAEIGRLIVRQTADDGTVTTTNIELSDEDLVDLLSW